MLSILFKGLQKYNGNSKKIKRKKNKIKRN